MPWCEPCAAYHAPTALDADGACPRCGVKVADASVPDREPRVGDRAPWHFWVVVALLAAYLLWRLVDGVVWLVS